MRLKYYEGKVIMLEGLLDTAFAGDFLLRFLLNEVTVLLISKQIYYKITQNRDYLFTMVIFNLVIFNVCYLLSGSSLSIGFAFGLFAIFSILRYRTETLPIKEMTYLFISISVAIINSIFSLDKGWGMLILINVMLTLVTLIMEKTFVKNEMSKNITYEKIELIKPESYKELLADLRLRTGLDIQRCEVGKIDFLHDIANVKIYYKDQAQS